MTRFKRVAMALALLLASCRPSLPDGYVYFYADDGRCIVDSKHEVIVPPALLSVAVVGDLVVGKRAEPAPVGQKKQRREGEIHQYFILDASTGAVRSASTDEKWRAQLADAGIRSPPQLRGVGLLSIR